MANNRLDRIAQIQQHILEELESMRYGDPSAQPTLGERWSDKLVNVMGSWKFIISQTIFLFVWLILNAFLVYGLKWDPYPFILLNLMLSFQAAYASPVILMAAQRSDSKDRRRAVDAYRSIANIERMLRQLDSNVDNLEKEQDETSSGG